MPNDRKVSSVGHDGQTIENVSDGKEDTKSEAEDVGQKPDDTNDVKDNKKEEENDNTGDERDNEEENDDDVPTIPSAPPAEEIQELWEHVPAFTQQ